MNHSIMLNGCEELTRLNKSGKVVDVFVMTSSFRNPALMETITSRLALDSGLSRG